jgi:hypothetical protein
MKLLLFRDSVNPDHVMDVIKMKSAEWGEEITDLQFVVEFTFSVAYEWKYIEIAPENEEKVIAFMNELKDYQKDYFENRKIWKNIADEVRTEFSSAWKNLSGICVRLLTVRQDWVRIPLPQPKRQ